MRCQRRDSPTYLLIRHLHAVVTQESQCGIFPALVLPAALGMLDALFKVLIGRLDLDLVCCLLYDRQHRSRRYPRLIGASLTVAGADMVGGGIDGGDVYFAWEPCRSVFIYRAKPSLYAQILFDDGVGGGPARRRQSTRLVVFFHRFLLSPAMQPMQLDSGGEEACVEFDGASVEALWSGGGLRRASIGMGETRRDHVRVSSPTPHEQYQYRLDWFGLPAA